jgi:hypothetical protein
MSVAALDVNRETKSGLERVELIAADKALLSLRSSGHDYCSAVGEVADNSLQAGAHTIRIRLFTTKKKIGKNTKTTEVVERIAVGDDGVGMDQPTLHNALRLGFSSRYNDREGMGRFGVGAKLAGISQAKRIDVYSRMSEDAPWLHTYIDLEEIEAKTMQYIPTPDEVELPADCGELVGSHGTLVIWSKTDRLEESESGGGRRADTVKTDLIRYIARTFRKFLDSGINIQFDGKDIFPHDPLYLMKSTQFHLDGESDPIAELRLRESIEFPVPTDPSRTSRVWVTFTVLPKAWRTTFPGSGRTDFAKQRRVHENEPISILRAGREIFFDTLRGVMPSQDGREKDRFIGKQIEFEPELDECFHVRNVKKGAEPIEGLRQMLKTVIFKTIQTLRTELSEDAAAFERQTLQDEGVHAEAEKVVAETQPTSRKPRAGKRTPPEVVEEKINEAAEAKVKDVPEELREEKKKRVKAQLLSQPYSVVMESWPGSELFLTQHLGSTIIVKMNMQHAFYTEVYSPLLTAEKQEDDAQAKELARLTRTGIDLLIAGFARGEGQFEDENQPLFESLRSNWGLELRSLVQHWRKQSR